MVSVYVFGSSTKSLIESYIFYLFSSYVTDFTKRFEVVWGGRKPVGRISFTFQAIKNLSAHHMSTFRTFLWIRKTEKCNFWKQEILKKRSCLKNIIWSYKLIDVQQTAARQPGVPFRGRSTVWWCSKTFFFLLTLPSLKFTCTPP